jgi:NAD+ synthase
VLKPAVQIACREAGGGPCPGDAGRPGLLVGCPLGRRRKLHNSVLLMEDGRISAVRHKVELRITASSMSCGCSSRDRCPAGGFRGVRIGVPICEDLWVSDVCECLVETGAEPADRPERLALLGDKAEERLQIAVARIVETGLPLI